MDRAIPEVNRIIVKRQHEMDRTYHLVKLRSIKQTIDNSVPFSYQYPINKKNKEQ